MTPDLFIFSGQVLPQPLDFIMMAVRGKKVGFDKIIKMIDDVVALFKEDQVDDDNKKEHDREARG